MNERVERAVELLRERGLDGILITSPTNRRYLSGFTADDHGFDETAGVLLIAADHQLLLTGGTNLPWATAEAIGFTTEAMKRPWPASIGERMAALGWKSAGFEDAFLSVADHALLQQSLGEGIALHPLGNAVDQLRAVKSADEIALMAEVTRLTDEAFVKGAATLRAGMTERELAQNMQAALREVGSEGEGFDTIVAAGPNAAKPHHRPGDRPIQAGEPVIIDMGALWHGYRGDLTRTIWIGEPDERLGAVYAAVLEAHNASKATVRAGVTGNDVDQASRDVFARLGYADYVIHGVGHGVGLRIHEAPSAGPGADNTLRAGETLTIEPGLYIAGWGGVRLENLVIVEEDGCRDLTTAPLMNL